MGPFYGMRLWDSLITLPIQRGKRTVGMTREGLHRSRWAHLEWCQQHPDAPEYLHHMAMVAKYDAALDMMRHWPAGTRVFKAVETLMDCDRWATDALLTSLREEVAA